MSYFDATDSPTLSRLQRLDGRTALVAGGAGYLGSQASDVLAELGAQVIIASRDTAKCQQRAKEISERNPSSPPAAGMHLDVTDNASVEQLASDLDARFSSVDVLVNFSWSGRKNSFASIGERDWSTDIDVSLTGPFRLIKAMEPLVQQSTGRVILNVASMYGVVAPDWSIYPSDDFTNPPSYGAAKAGVIQLTKYLASFLAGHSIRVNCLSPGPFPFPKTLSESPEFERRLVTKNPLRRVGRPHELRGAVAFLCTDASSFMTGQNVCVDGGWTAW